MRPAGGPPVIPSYDATCLSAVLPGIARALGVESPGPAIDLPESSSVCLVVIDGLGAELLAESAADAPFLTELAAGGRVLRAGCPTTTATSMGSLGTGLPPGQHGLVGYAVRDPDRGVVLNHLTWDPYTDPHLWQRHPTVFERCTAAGVAVTHIGAAEFDGTGLTVAAHRGAEFVGAEHLADRVDLALADSPADRRLTYLYWGAVDKAGHERGWRSPQWRAELRATDQQLARLAGSLPGDTALVITADHGMVDVPHASRLDIADHPELRAGVAILGGEPRMVQVYCHDGRVAEVAARFADAVGERAWIRTRDEAIAEGWFGPVSARVRPRLGDVLIAAREDFAVVDSELAPPKALTLIGHHGSLTETEQLIPLLTA